jgi:hypothetical protein
MSQKQKIEMQLVNYCEVVERRLSEIGGKVVTPDGKGMVHNTGHREMFEMCVV